MRNTVSSPNILSVHPGFPAHNLKEFVAYVKAHPGKESYANAGAGGINDRAWPVPAAQRSQHDQRALQGARRRR